MSQKKRRDRERHEPTHPFQEYGAESQTQIVEHHDHQRRDFELAHALDVRQQDRGVAHPVRLLPAPPTSADNAVLDTNEAVEKSLVKSSDDEAKSQPR